MVFLFSLSIILESNKNVDEGYLHGIVFSASYIDADTDCYDGIKKLNEIKTESVPYKLSIILIHVYFLIYNVIISFSSY